MSDQDYRSESEKRLRKKIAAAEKQQREAEQKASKRDQRLNAASSRIGGYATAGDRGAVGLAKVDVPFVKMSGYIVRGTDEASFVRCGSSAVHYTRMSGEAISRLVQRYRFRASKPLAAVYFTFDGRILDDTVQLGPHLYTSVVEIEKVYPDTPDERPACPAPRWGSLIEGPQVSARP